MLLIFLFSIFSLGFPYKILVFSPTVSRSHMISNGRIADTLSAAGHEVVMFEPDFMKIYDKVHPVKLARRWPAFNFSSALATALEKFSHDVFEDETVYYYAVGWSAFSRAYNELCQGLEHCKISYFPKNFLIGIICLPLVLIISDLISRDDVMSKLRAENFDLYIGEHQNMCGNGMAHALGIKTQFWVSSRSIGEQMSWVSGLPFTHSYVAASFGVDMGDKPTYLDRINNFAMGISFVIGMKYHNRQLNQIFRDKFGPEFPNVETISGNSDLILIATDEFVDINRPILPNLIHIGGLGLKDTVEPLDKVFELEMSKGKLGVIYFSLGTVVNTTLIPNFALKTVLDTAKRFPKYHFIVKVDKADKFAFEYASSIPNVYITSWVPQPAILANLRLRVFITHAGYNGVMEAARAGVPLITIPFMVDQTKNSRAVANSGWGLILRRQTLRDKPEALGDSLQEILTNPKYKQQALRIRRLIRNKPFNATERLIKWTEFVLSNGGLKELLVEGRNLDWFTYYNLDIFIPITLGIFVVVYLILKLVSFLLTMIIGSPKVKTE